MSEQQHDSITESMPPTDELQEDLPPGWLRVRALDMDALQKVVLALGRAEAAQRLLADNPTRLYGF